MRLFIEYSSLWRLSINNRHKLEYSVNNHTRQLTVQPIATSNGRLEGESGIEERLFNLVKRNGVSIVKISIFFIFCYLTMSKT